MDALYITIAAVFSSLLTNLVNMRGTRIKNDGDSDKVLTDRIRFLDERVTNLEELACFKKDCKLRV